VLDVGCGTGNLSLPLASLGYPVTGIDVDPASVADVAAKNPFAWASFRVADPLSFEPGRRFPIIVLSEVLEHLEDPARALARLAHLAEPGGLLVLTVPNGYGPWEGMNLAKRALVRAGLGGPLVRIQRRLGYRGTSLQSRSPHLEHVQFFTAGRLRRLARAAGFRVAAFRSLSLVVGVFPLSWLFRRAPALERLDSALARLLPRVLASGWLLELVREEEAAGAGGGGLPSAGTGPRWTW
jgi:SAM-dependent methyltransferase